MPYKELLPWWEVDFDVLTSTAVAEATGKIHSSVSTALRSDDWIDQWVDALYAASGELASSVERMAYTGDQRQAHTRKMATLVHKRMDQINGKLRTRRQEQAKEGLANKRNAHTLSLTILAKHHAAEVQELIEQQLHQRGLPSSPPLPNTTYDTQFDAVEDAVEHGLLHAPITPETQALLTMGAKDLTNRVARDVTDQNNRCTQLRHPLMLRRWTDALVQLRDRNCDLVGLEPMFTVSLPALDVQSLRELSNDQAWAVINRRRFIRALAQRKRECDMHVRDVVRISRQRRKQIMKPWRQAVDASYQEMGRRHPEQMHILMSAFEPYCVPGSTHIRNDRTDTVRQLIPALQSALTSP